jgi:plastocyanin
MARKGWIYGIAALVLVFAACGGDDDDSSNAGGTTTTTAAAEGGAETVTVNVDASPASTSMAFTAYFPNEVTLHPGDTIDFASNFSGEPHTVTFGTLVDEGMAKADPNAQDEPAELKKIPPLLPDGPGDAIQASAQPCFLASGDPPASDACSADQQKQPDFDGTQTYYNSGFLADGDTFEVKLADDLRPGTYAYFCALHRGGMTGTVTVVAADAKAQSADEVEEAAQKALSDAQAQLQPAVDAIKKGTLPPFLPTAAPGSVIAGGGAEESPSGVPVLFGPDSVDVKVGDSVTWTIIGPHTVTFGGDETLRTAIARAPDGGVHLNEQAFAPAGGAGQPQGPPPEAPGPPIAIDGGSYDGSGVHSSGVVLSFPPQLYTYSLKFTKAGTYDYFCTIHADMKGVVNVT